MANIIHLIGYASDVAAANRGSADGPLQLRNSSYLGQFKNKNIELLWSDMIQSDPSSSQSKLFLVTQMCQKIADQVAELVKQKQFFITLGGDHSCAIGTWSGVAHAIKQSGPLGLIWIDAHMDSHTPKTTPTGNIHGMPLAALLGEGESSLTTLLDASPKLQPKHVCLIGVRSFEAGEAALLERLNVRVFYMDEIKQRGLSAVFSDAVQIASQGTAAFGLSLDIDSIDPKEAPGTGVAEPDGLSAQELCEALSTIAHNTQFIGAEIAEFDPHRDKNHCTEQLIFSMLSALTLGKT